MEKGWSQIELAEKMGLSNSSLISSYESGRIAVPLKAIAKIAALLKQDLNYLILGKRELTSLEQATKAINSLKSLIMVQGEK